MKKSIFLFLFSLFFYACSSSVDTSSMSEEERLAYAMTLFNNEDYQEALAEYQGVLLQYPGSQSVDDAQYYLGLTHFKREEYILSAYEFSKLIKDMPASEFVPEAQYMLAESYYLLSPSFHLDQRYTKKGIEEFQAFIDFFPAHEKVPEAEAKIKEMNTKLAKKLFEAARIYEKMEYNISAVEYYQEIENIYHDTQYAPMASYRKIKVLMLDDKKKDAAKEINSFLSRYPNDPNAEEVKQLGQTLGGA